MSTPSLLMLVPMLALLAWAAVQDAATRRIPNWLSFSLILSGLLHGWTSNGSAGLSQSLLGMLSAFGLMLVLYALRAVGGGDVKLLAGVGAWLGAWAAIQVFAMEAVIGMIIVLIQAQRQGRLRTLFRNSAVLAINLAHVSDVGVDHVSNTGQSCRSVDRPLPYAVPVCLAVFILTAGRSLAAGVLL
jgi:prepilin peptidase CpaA